MEFLNCFSVTLDKSKFSNNSDSSFGGVVEFSNTVGIQITRSNFTNNRVSSFSGVIRFSASAGTIGCTHFYNNSASSFGGIVTIEQQSTLYVSNSSFHNNTLSTFGGVIRLDSTNDNVIVVSSIFVNTEHSSFGGVIKLDDLKSSATVIASKFINTWSSRRNSRHGAAVYSDSQDITIDCCDFINTTIPNQYHNDTNLCNNYNIPETCEDTECELTDCTPPEVKISLEKSEFVVSETIGNSFSALQVCAVAKDLLYQVEVNLQIHNGSATEEEDYITGSPDSRILKFSRQAGTQKACAYIRIIEDSVQEGDEQFYVSLESLNHPVVFDTQRAVITIVEGHTVADEHKHTTQTLVTGLSKFALVECGPLRRPISYASGGNDLNNLKTAIVQEFRGLTGISSGKIALLQVKSDVYEDYIDKPFSSSTTLPQNSQVKVLTYESFTCLPRYVPGN